VIFRQASFMTPKAKLTRGFTYFGGSTVIQNASNVNIAFRPIFSGGFPVLHGFHCHDTRASHSCRNGNFMAQGAPCPKQDVFSGRPVACGVSRGK
jgi:Cu/Zn superoxide dismutase